MPKDLFSNHAALYSKFRPTYPKELYEYIISFVDKKDIAWDCATGNGQAAIALADYFKKIIATDISEDQLRNAVVKPNIIYKISTAEKTPFPDGTFDLITVATAYHWFQWDAFYQEATRVGRNGSVVAIWTYYTCESNDEKLNNLYHHFYRNVTHSYWEYERRYVDDKYETVPFDFEPLPSKQFFPKVIWTRKQFAGYLESWSAVQKFIKKNNVSPLKEIEEELKSIWADDETKEIIFPIALRLGRIVK
ncbi:MAG: class I SAM-dependent methyltransferase [Chitinophagaceae bacterium]